jgi:hypothetical protein
MCTYDTIAKIRIRRYVALPVGDLLASIAMFPSTKSVTIQTDRVLVSKKELKTLGIPHLSTRQRRPIPQADTARPMLGLRVDDERIDRPQSTPISMGAISRALPLPNKKL